MELGAASSLRSGRASVSSLRSRGASAPRAVSSSSSTTGIAYCRLYLLEELVRGGAPPAQRAALERDELDADCERHENEAEQDWAVHAPPFPRNLLTGEPPRARDGAGDDKRPARPVVNRPKRERAPGDDKQYQPGHGCFRNGCLRSRGRFSPPGRSSPPVAEGTHSPVHTEGRVPVFTNPRPGSSRLWPVGRCLSQFQPKYSRSLASRRVSPTHSLSRFNSFHSAPW